MIAKRTASHRHTWRITLLAGALATVGVVAAEAQPSLSEAARQGDTDAVRQLLRQGADVNAAAPDGTTALHWAADRGDAAMASILLQAGARPDVANRFGARPLALACAAGANATVDLLLSAGADVHAVSGEGETPLMTAATTGNVPLIRALLARTPNINAVEGWKGQTALMWAAAGGHVDAVSALLAAGADVARRSNGGYTALLFAVRNGHIATADALVAAGANVNDRLVRPGAASPVEGTSALVLAIINAHFELAAHLLERGADPNAADPRGSALHALAWIRRPGLPQGRVNVPPPPTGTLGSLALAELLLAKGANANARVAWKEQRFDRDDGETRLPPDISVGRAFITFIGATPFYLAAKHADVALMRLLADKGADTRLGTVQNVTPLMAAAGFGFWDGESPSPMAGVPDGERLAAVKLAVELGADVNAVADFGDATLIGDREDLMYRYPDNLARLPPEILGDPRWGGSTALHGAAVLTDSPEQHDIIRFLVSKGARLDARTKLGWTPLMITEGILAGASNTRDSPRAAEVVRTLLREQGLDPDTLKQRAPLHERVR